MTKKVQYTKTTGDGLPARDDALTENSSLYLIEEQNITEGNFLIFQDTKPVPTVEQTVGTLETAADSLSEQMAQVLLALVQGGLM